LSKRSAISRIVALTLLAGALLQRPAFAPGNIIVDANSDVFNIGSGGGGGGWGYSQAATQISSTVLSQIYRVGQPLRVALVSSGVDRGIFPVNLQSKISLGYGQDADTYGYGDYAATALFQAVSDTAQISITSFNVYPDGKLTLDWLTGSLRNIVNSPDSYDVVLLAFPPGEVLDPITAAMNAGVWDQVVEKSRQQAYSSPSGPLFGIPKENSVYYGIPHSYQADLYVASFRRLMNYWEDQLLYPLRGIVNAFGIPVIMPAGDYGNNPQTVMGLANLAEVITVGGYNIASGTVSAASSVGPSIDLRIKPDLLAPTALPGLVKTGLPFANALSAAGVTNPSLTPYWPDLAGDPGAASSVRALSDTTLAAAGLTAAIAGALRSGGLSMAKIRGALYASSAPIAGVPVYRQGEGVLGGPNLTIDVADAAAANSLPLTLSHGDLGVEPNTSSWGMTVPVANGSASGTTTALTDFIGVSLTARTVLKTITQTSLAAPVTATSNSAGFSLAAPVGMDDIEAGYYCGYVPIALTSSSISRTQQVATCLTNAFDPLARAVSIHNRSVDSDTYSLTPSIPPGGSVFEQPLHQLPISPVGTGFISSVSGARACERLIVEAGVEESFSDTCHGHAPMTKVPPGYYLVSHFANYGAPIDSTLNAGSFTKTADIGEPVNYSAFHSVLLPRATRVSVPPEVPPELCPENYGRWDDWAGQEPDEISDDDQWKKCSQDFLNAQLPPTEPLEPPRFAYDGPTGGFIITASAVSPPLAEPIRVNLGYIRKAAIGSVSSRVIDIIHPCSQMSKKTKVLDSPVAQLGQLIEQTSGNPSWSFVCEPGGLLGSSVPGGSGVSGVGIGTLSYPFNLPLPNYTAKLNLNFGYHLVNAFIVVTVVMGSDVAVGIVTPDAKQQMPPLGLHRLLNLGNVNASGQADGTAHFEFPLVPNQAPGGTIYLTFVPSQIQGLPGAGAPIAKIKDDPTKPGDTLSMELTTWASTPWPGVDFTKVAPAPTSTIPAEVLSVRLGNAPAVLAKPKCKKNQHDNCGHFLNLNSNFNGVWPNDSGGYGGGQIGATSSAVPECRNLSGFEGTATVSSQVCEDWTVLVHSPTKIVDSSAPADKVTATAASFMDILDSSDANPNYHASAVSDLINAGGKLVVPVPVTSTAKMTTVFATLANPGAGTMDLSVNGAYFEQLLLPMAFLRSHQRDLTVCIRDSANSIPTSSNCAGTWSYNSANSIWLRQSATTNTVTAIPRDWGPAPCSTSPTGYLGCGKPVRVTPYVSYQADAILMEDPGVVGYTGPPPPPWCTPSC